jgi:hypothetical protein
MTEESERDLVKRAETALSGMALPEPDWDGLVLRIEGSVATAPPENEALFEAPFPATAEDGTADAPLAAEKPAEPVVADSVPTGDALATVAETDTGPTISVAPESAEELDDGWSSKPEAASAAAEEPVEIEATSEPTAARAPEAPRETVSLADLARASIARRGSSEAANIAKESLAMASQSRARGGEVAQRVQAASSVAPPPRSVAPPPPSARRSTAPPANAQGGDVMRGPWIGVAIAGVGLAAAFALVLSGRNNQAPVAVIETAQHKVTEPTTPAPIAKVEAPPAVEAEALPAPRAALDATALPSVPHEAAPRAEAKPAPAGAKAASPTPTPAPGKVVAEKIVLEEEGKAAPKAAPSAPRPADAKLRPAELSNDGVTERPSAGAAQAAVGSVLGAARACVAGHPQPSSAQLVFSSDGQVQSVAVAGPAAGTPAAGCIESALKKARVQPFAASSFSLGVTIRPPERRAD